MKLVNYFATALAVIGLVGISSCSDLSEIENRLDSIESEIKKFDTLIEELNNNVESLYYLKDGNVITDVKETADGWEITLSNGRIIELKNGTDGVDGNTPEVSISEDGYWVINGVKQPVKATATDGEDGKDGITPKFGVDAEGYWTVSYDGGQTYERVKDADGNEVLAKVEVDVTGGSSFFSSVEIKDNYLVLTLLNGDVITVPIVKGFNFIIKKDGTLVEGVQQLAEGSSVTFDVEQKGVAAAAIVACPAGFEAELTETALTVTAVAQTKATASTAKDLAILAVSNTGVSVLSKIQIEKSAPEAPVASASITLGVATSSTLTFTVTLVNATAYKYLLLEATADAPTAEILTAEGIEATTSTLTIDALKSATAYILYVLPIGGDKVVNAKATTTEFIPSNDYEKYMAGLDITIGDITINKVTYGDATLISDDSEDKNIAGNGVYFVASDATDVTINGSASQLIVLSLDENVATIKRTENKSFYLNASEETDYLVFSNIKYETVMTAGNVFGIGLDGEVEMIYFHKCKIEIPADMNMLYSAKNILNFNMTDCDVRLHVGTAEKNLVQTNTTSTYETLVFKNNIFYSTDGDLTGFRLFWNSNATVSKLDFRNNTIAGVYCKATLGYVTVKSITAGDVENNLLYLPNYTTHLDGKYIGILHIADKVDEHLNMNLNLAFYNYADIPTYRAKCSYTSNNGTIYNMPASKNPIPSPDYVNGVFTQGEEYKSYGAKR